MAQYVVAVGYVEDEDVAFVEGPDVPDWKAFCDALVPQAAQRALDKAIPADDVVNWDEIVDSLLEVLEERGYRTVRRRDLPDAVYIWEMLFHEYGHLLLREHLKPQRDRLGPLLERIIEHNDSLMEQ